VIRLLVICEGPTEAEFVGSCLEPHLRDFGLAVHASLLKTRPGKVGGGAVSIERSPGSSATADEQHRFRAPRGNG
jgi:hypothetical protein